MKKINYLFFIMAVLLSTSCNTTTAEDIFSDAVLNTNLIYGFADEGMVRELASPSVKSDGTAHGYVTMKRKEIIDTKIAFIEKAFENVKALKKQNDNTEMLEASIALCEFVLPVYKSDYSKLAALYDAGASESIIDQLAQDIHIKNYSTYERLSSRLLAAGKLYAARHNIKVNYVNPSPS